MEDIYAFQHFGFTAKQVTLERQHLLQVLLKTGFKSLIGKAAAQNPNTAEALQLKQDEIVLDMLKSFESELKELAALDIKYFQIPDDVLLAQDFDHITNYTEAQISEIDREIEKHKEMFLENSVLIKSLEQQEELFEDINPFVQQHIEVRERTKAAINLLNKNTFSHMFQLIHATKQVAQKLKNCNSSD